jgi:hypothetical protein
LAHHRRQVVVDNAGLAFVAAGLRFQAVKTGETVGAEPGFKGFPALFFGAQTGDVRHFLRHFFKIAGLFELRVVQDRGNDAKAQQRHFFGQLRRKVRLVLRHIFLKPPINTGDRLMN